MLDAGAEEGLDGFFRRVDDGLPFHIEAGVQHHLAARGFAHGQEQRVKVGIVLGADGLQARGAVDVRDRGQLIAQLGTDVDDADHVGEFSAGLDLEPAVRLFHRAGRRKGPEGLALLYHGIDAVAHLGMPGIGQDAAIAERARTVLHAAARPRDDAAVGDELGCGGAGFVRAIA